MLLVVRDLRGAFHNFYSGYTNFQFIYLLIFALGPWTKKIAFSGWNMAHAVIFWEGIIGLLLGNVFIKLNVTISLHQNWTGIINMGIHSTISRGSHIKCRIYFHESRNTNKVFQGLPDHSKTTKAPCEAFGYYPLIWTLS